jgi:hypothetical protein
MTTPGMICVKITTTQYHPETGNKRGESFIIADQRDLATELALMVGSRPFDHPLDREPELRPVVVMRFEWLRASPPAVSQRSGASDEQCGSLPDMLATLRKREMMIAEKAHKFRSVRFAGSLAMAGRSRPDQIF